MGYGNYIDPFAALRPDYTVGAGEKLELTFVVLPGESRDIDVAIDLVGEGAEVSLKGLYLCGGDERVNFRILMHHRAGGCVSRQLFNGIAGGTSRVTFDGRIIVAPDAQQTEAYQENHNIVLTDGAHVETTPQLEIYADDVKCSHGATTGRLDEEIPERGRTRKNQSKNHNTTMRNLYEKPDSESLTLLMEKNLLQESNNKYQRGTEPLRWQDVDPRFND